jgi:hypothetical protein
LAADPAEAGWLVCQVAGDPAQGLARASARDQALVLYPAAADPQLEMCRIFSICQPQAAASLVPVDRRLAPSARAPVSLVERSPAGRPLRS